MQVTPAEWLVEYGLLGMVAIIIFLLGIFKGSMRKYGLLGAGAFLALMAVNMFQANWKWEAWFFALAFLATGATGPKTERNDES